MPLRDTFIEFFPDDRWKQNQKEGLI